MELPMVLSYSELGFCLAYGVGRFCYSELFKLNGTFYRVLWQCDAIKCVVSGFIL